VIQTDVAVIGAGPAGLYATYYAGFRGFKVVVIDALAEIGGQITAMYPEKEIFDIAGFASVKGRDLIDGLTEQANSAKPIFKMSTQVSNLVQVAEGIHLTLDSGEEIFAKVVIIAGGIGAFTPRALPTGMEWLGKGLVHFVPSLAEHAGKRIVIAGGGDSAFDWAYSLKPIAKSVTLIHRRNEFRAHAATVEQVKAMGVDLITSAEITSIKGDEAISSVEITMKESGEVRAIECETVVAALGFVANIGPIANWGIDLQKRHVLVDSTMETSIKRVFAVGDIATYVGKIPLISVGFGEAALAVNNAAPYIDPNFGVFPGHSSGSSSD
jgi:thioredoxin reductase